MKNVKPMVGQVWVGNQSKSKWEVNFIDDNNLIHYGRDDYAATPLHISEFVDLFKFTPQTDLEWLAVNESEWGGDDEYPSIFRDMVGYVNYRFKSGNPDCYIYQQWQNKRYELGLDEKPIIKLVKSHAVSMGRAPDDQKETEMNTDNLIPISFVKNFTPLFVGDEIYNSKEPITFVIDGGGEQVLNLNEYIPEGVFFLKSFADRPNTGKQPVGDDVVVDTSWLSQPAHASGAGWELDPELSCNETWKPNHAAMLKQYQAEQALQSLKEGDVITASSRDELPDAVMDKAKEKETKMIDLNGVKVGDSLVLRNSEVVNVLITHEESDQMVVGNEKAICICDMTTGAGSECSEYDIVSKHEPRHWLKDLPDVGLFNDEVKFLAWCNHRKGWCAFGGEPIVDFDDSHTNGFFSNYPLTGIKMPKLTGDEWKDSKISILDLKAWQLKNKEQS